MNEYDEIINKNITSIIKFEINTPYLIKILDSYMLKSKFKDVESFKLKYYDKQNGWREGIAPPHQALLTQLTKISKTTKTGLLIYYGQKQSNIKNTLFHSYYVKPLFIDDTENI